MKINKMRPQECEFTKVLIPLALNVEMLYCYGELPELADFWTAGKLKEGRLNGAGRPFGRCPAVAIVGARRNTAYGYEVAYKAAYAAARAGAVVVSGLALGIDSVAHRAALDAGGVTVAVLGTPIDRIYPEGHTALAREIVAAGGAVISEYGPGDEAGGGKEAKARFLQRNRIIAGLSDVVLVAEAAERSGTLNTATHALSQGKDLMVVPGDITRASSAGCNKLLTQGALPYTEPSDLLEVLFGLGCGDGSRGDGGSGAEHLTAREKELQRLSLLAENETEAKVLGLMATGALSGEEIIAKGELSPTEFNQTVTILEIKGIVRALGANRWMIK
ncbi:DNA-processing protein DprA [Candidatus Saccharibacteria bacterium]|nr:DNA-processing protein DprA [Candidatus Saccharibacteria bacterium]